MKPATAARAAPITNVRLIVRSVSMPSRLAIFRSCSQARMVRPSGVLVTSQVKMPRMVTVITTMASCIQDSATVKFPLVINGMPPGMMALIGFTRAPWLT